MNVALIVSGQLEHRALSDSLRRALEAHGAIDLRVEATRVESFTSARVPEPPVLSSPKGTLSAVLLMARALIAAIAPGRRGTPADLAIAIDDLELDNADRPHAVVNAFRIAIERALADRAQAESWSLDHSQRVQSQLRERASFHLFAPMIEAYFFADPLALQATSAKPPQLDATRDVEDFQTTDAGYLASCDEVDRARSARHPKRYVEFLTDGAYRETAQGVEALRALRWPTVLTRSDQVRFARTLLADAVEATCGTFLDGELHPLTRRREGGLLRNL